jgi:hypothetical protein
LWGALSDETTGLYFVHAAGPCQRSLSRVRVSWYSRPYFTVSATCVTCQNACSLARCPALGMARTTCKTPLLLSECVFIGPLPSTGRGADHTENTSSNTFSIVACSYFGRCLEMGLYVTIYTNMFHTV